MGYTGVTLNSQCVISQVNLFLRLWIASKELIFCTQESSVMGTIYNWTQIQ
jgi:hypothetical protein